MKRIAVIGTGYVGLVTGTCFAELGDTVVCLDNNAQKIETLRGGQAPFYEPQLLELIVRNQHAGRLVFSTDVAAGIRDAEVIFIAVDTPMADDGAVDLSAVRAVAAAIGRALNGPKTVISKSTVPVETGDLIASIIAENSSEHHRVDVVSNPEFLREGSAVADFMQPDRIVIGTNSPEAEALMRDLYRSLDVPILVTDVRTSEMIKYAANAFLATKISFMNEIANICDLVDVDVKAVGRGIGFDHRIGTQFMSPGIGFGGSCFPKDVRALEMIAAGRQYEAVLLRAVESINRAQIDRTLAKIVAALGGNARGKTVGVLGLAFKPNTDDVREAPAVHIIERLLAAGAMIRAHDPVAIPAVRAKLGEQIVYCDQMYEALHEADALLLATEWNEYKNIDFVMVRKLMRGDKVVDGRNLFDPDAVVAAGLDFIGMGRRKRGRRYLRLLAKLLIVALPLALAALVLRESVDIPFWDEWDWTDLVYAMQHGTLAFSQLWAQHNEHRILIPNLIMLALAHLGGWHPIREQFVSLAVLLCSQAVIVLMMRRTAHGTTGWLAAAAASLMLYELGQAQNFLWGFQMGWFICDFCTIAVTWLLTQPNRHWWHILLAIIAATIGTYSSAQGILAWAVGAVAILLAGVHGNRIVAQRTSPLVIPSGAPQARSRGTATTLALWLLIAIVEYAIYQHGMTKVAAGHSNIAANPIGIVLYALTYLGAPALGGRGTILSAVAGLALIAAVASYFIADVRSSQRIRRMVRNAPWYALSVFPLLCAAGTAVGRGAFGQDQALEQRYVTVSVLGWIALIGLAAGTIARLPRPYTPRLRTSLLALTAIFVFVIASDDDKGLKQMHQFSATLHAGLTDPTKLYPDPRRLKQLMAERQSL